MNLHAFSVEANWDIEKIWRSNPMAQLTITGLRKSYAQHEILRGISLEIQSGEWVSLLGPSGSGKTTALRCIAGLEIPNLNSGEIRLEEKTLSGPGVFIPPEKRHLGMVFQNYAVWPHLNVFENVAFPLRVARGSAKLTSPEIQKRTHEAIALVRLDGLEKRYAHQLSGGQQQRVALARALTLSPKLLLLDEPLSNLDALLREELGAEIRRLQKALKLTTILVTHDQWEALTLSDRIFVLNQGEVVAQGSPEELLTRAHSPFVEKFLARAKASRIQDAKTDIPIPSP